MEVSEVGRGAIRPVRVVILMGPPGSGKSYLGNELHRRGVVSYTELEPKLLGIFGPEEAFRARRQEALQWIQKFYREELSSTRDARGSGLPMCIETTGISDRPFIEELSRDYGVLFVRLTTLRDVCVERVRTRPRGRNIATHSDSGVGFYDYWCAEIAPTYRFDVVVSGVDCDLDVSRIRDAIEAKASEVAGPT